jgi:hypothetical protein
MYYIAVIEIDPKWEKNNEGQVDFEVALDEKIKWGIGFQGEICESLLAKDVSRVKLGRNRKIRRKS